MANTFDELIESLSTPSGTEPVTSGAGVDELARTAQVAQATPAPAKSFDELFERMSPRESAPVSQPEPSAPLPEPREAPEPQQPAKSFDELLTRMGGGDVSAPREPGLTTEGFEQAIGKAPEPAAEPQPWMATQMGQLFVEGIKRDWSRLRATPGTLQGIFAELQGNEEEMRQYMAEADAIEKMAPEAKWHLRNIKGVEDLFYWLSERFGENALTILATMATAGAGGLVAGAASHGLRLGPGATRALVTGGTFSVPYGLMASLEGANTAQELYEATGSTHPYIYKDGALGSIGAGLIKGGLETITPFVLTRALTKTGIQWGTTLPRGIVKGSLLEAGTEGTQEMIDIMALKALASREYLARKFGDPNYSFFGDGPEWLGEAGWRMLEAMSAGGALGGAFGGATHVIERRQAKKPGGELDPDEPFMAPGEQEVPPAPAATDLRSRINPLAAIRMPDGTIHEGSTHTRAIMNAGIPEDQLSQTEAGWMVNGQFMNREETDAFLKSKEFTDKYGPLVTEYLTAEKLGQEVVEEDGGFRVLTEKERRERSQKESFVDVLGRALAQRDQGEQIRMLADDPVEITPKFENKHSVTWEVKSQFGKIHARVNKIRKEVHISSSTLEGDAKKGMGHGLALYKAVVDKALAAGYVVRSDMITSTEAARAYEGLRRRGYEVEGPMGEIDEDQLGGFYQAWDENEGVYRITAGPQAEPPEGEKIGQVAKKVMHPASEGAAMQRELTEAAKAKAPEGRLPSKDDVWGEEILKRKKAGQTLSAIAQELGLPLGTVRRISEEETRAKGFGLGGLEGEKIGATAKLGDELREEAKVAGVKVYRPGTREIAPLEPTIEDTGDLLPRNEQQDSFEDQLGDGKVPPITRMMEKIAPAPPLTGEVSPDDIRAVPPEEDIWGLVSLLRSSVEIGADEQATKEWIEAQTPRYAVTGRDGKPLAYLMNDVDLERTLSTLPAWHDMPVHEVRQGSLEPGAITADVLDLPMLEGEGANRLWFIPGVSPEEKLRLTTAYEQLAQIAINNKTKTLVDPKLEGAIRAELEEYYNPLVSKGLRVVPSYGASFNYTGLMERKGPGPTSSKRSEQIAFLSVETGQLLMAKNLQLEETREFNQSTGPLQRTPETFAVVAIDLNKLKPGDYELVTVDAPDKDKIAFETLAGRPRSYTRQKLIVKNKVTIDKLVAASEWFDPEAFGSEHWAKTVRSTLLTLDRPNRIEVLEDRAHDPVVLRVVQETLKTMLPKIDKLLLRFGMKHKPTYFITHGGGSSLFIGTNAINIDTLEIKQMAAATGTTPEFMTYQTLGHELGHMISLYYYKNTNPEMQAKIRYAWEKAKLAQRTYAVPEARLMAGIFTPAMHGEFNFTKISYYMSFSEFMAEQIRRAMIADKEIRTDIDQTFDRIGDQLNRFIKLWNDEVDPVAGKDMSNPDVAMAAWLNYLEQHGKDKVIAEQKIKQLGLYFHQDEFLISDSPQMTERLLPLYQAVEEFVARGIFPKRSLFTRIIAAPRAEKGADVMGQFSPPFTMGENQTMPWLDLVVGALPFERTLETSRTVVAHELVHALRYLGMISDAEMEVLYQGAKEEGVVSESELYRIYRPRIEEWGEKMGFTKNNTWATWKEEILRDTVREEMVAYMMGSYANGMLTKLPSEQVTTLLDKIMLILRAIRDKFFDAGVASKEQLIQQFFAGELSSRPAQAKAKNAKYAHITRLMDMDGYEVTPSKIVPVPDSPGVFAAVEYVDPQETGEPDRVVYIFYNRPPLNRNAPNLHKDLQAGGKLLGWLELEGDGTRGYEPHIETTGKTPGFSRTMLQFAEQDMGVELMPAGSLTQAGYLIARMKFKQEMKLYQFDEETGFWFSPNYIRERMGYHQYTVKYSSASARQKEFSAGRLRKWKALHDKIPKEVWQNPLLDKIHSLDQGPVKYGALGSMIRAGDKVEESQVKEMAAQSDGGPTIDPVEAINRQAAMDSQYQNYRKNEGVSFGDGAPQMPMFMLRDMFRQSWIVGDVTPAERGLMPSGISFEADRINWFTRIWYGIKQMAWRNPSVMPLQKYVGATESMHSSIAQWLTRADDTAREWDKGKGSSPEQRRNVSSMMFWLAEMRYRTPAEIAAGMPPRYPTPAERAAYERSLGMNQWAKDLVDRVQLDFADFLNEVERIGIERINRTISDPTAKANALAKLATDMADFRRKPYFPMTRFGKYTLTVRDPSTPGRKVAAMYAFDSLAQRRSAQADVAAQWPGMLIVPSVVPESAFEFMGLPTPLLEIIKTDMKPSLTPDQLAWIEEFQHLHAPDNTFRKRWLPQKQLPGYSMDGFRVYASYFINGSRYLGRAEFGHEMQTQINVLRASLRSGRLVNARKRAQLINYVQRHYKYIMEGGRDYAKAKAAISVWQLGFSVAAAGMNLTQVPHVTWPMLSGIFGTTRASGALSNVNKALKNARGYAPKGSGQYAKAREVLRTWQRVDIGQAAELGAFAEGKNLLGLSAGTRGQKAFRWISHASMYMFGAVESFNREWTALAAYELARANPKAKYKPDRGLDPLNPGTVPTIETAMTIKYQAEWKRLIDPKNFADGIGLTNEEAVATLFAREVIDRTQFVYAPYARPTFLRSPVGSLFLVFFGYIQAMTYAFRFNPGMVQYLLIAMALYGMMGAIPGGEDFLQMIRAIGRKIFGKDWDVEEQARKYVRQVTRGTVFDEVGPDLFLHGLSKHGFGMGLLPDGWAFGKFDASANGSLGKIVPGLFEASRAMATGGDYKQIVTDVSQRMAGAGFGWFFTALKVAMEPKGSSDLRQWEQLLPRAIRAQSKMIRYATEGETTRQGGRIASFDLADPEDLFALAWQAVGFTPTKVTNTWDYLRAVRDQLNIYKADKLALYGQMDRAMQARNPEAIRDVTKAIERFNKDVMEVDPSMAMRADSVRQSIINRNKTRFMQELHLPNIKGQVPVAKRLRDLYPGVAPPPGTVAPRVAPQRFTDKEAQNTADTIEGVRRLLRHDWRINPEGRLSDMVEDRTGEGSEDPTGGLETQDQARRRKWEEEMFRHRRPR